MTSVHGNSFLNTIRDAAAQNWCMAPYCTTCGCTAFRDALRKVGGATGGSLADALCDMDLDELTSLPDWRGAVEIAVRDLPYPGQAASLLESWLGRADQHLRFFDFVLYRIVRCLPEGHPIRSSMGIGM